METDKMLNRRLEKIEDNLEDISASLKRISSEARLATDILLCNLPLLVSIEQYKAGTICIEDLRKMFNQSTEIMKKAMNGMDIL